jgi:hypothetical protein
MTARAPVATPITYCRLGWIAFHFAAKSCRLRTSWR